MRQLVASSASTCCSQPCRALFTPLATRPGGLPRRPARSPAAWACASGSHPSTPSCGGGASRQRSPPRRVLRRAFEQSSGGGDPTLADYVEVKIDDVRSSQGASVVYLRVVGSDGVIPVHIGETESNALQREMNKSRQLRPLTHDLFKNTLAELGYRVTKVRVTDIIANTYYARVHIRGPGAPEGEGSAHEVDVDARPSDAINLALRFGAPIYVNKRIAESASPVPAEQYAPSNETHADIVRSVRETLSSYEDPTVMIQLQKELAVKEERFEDAAQFQESILHEMTHNRLLRLVVAMESALADGRYDEAAHLRDEYRKTLQQQAQATAEQRKLL